ncbi:HAD family hydrolase [Alicyclobacillus tengchongensis]|nr:HAD family hydrolase [Alicyclobacillus tengchongensis]
MSGQPLQFDMSTLHKGMFKGGSFELALLDLDGTLWRGSDVIEGAPEFVERLRHSGIRPVFFTNNSSRTPEAVVAALQRMGFTASVDEVCTSAQAAADAVSQRVPKSGAIVAYVGGEGLREALRKAGFDARRADGKDIREPWVKLAQAAAVGLDPGVTYGDLAVVSRIAYRVGWFPFTNPDVRLPVEDGFMPGNGAIGAFVAAASSAEVVVTGKPDPSFVRYALSRYGVPVERAFIVGDNLHTDILAGNQTGVYSVFVRSGISGEPKDGDPQPDLIVDSVANLFRQNA